MTQRPPSQQRYQPASVETVRVVNVNIMDWTVDVVSELGDKRYLDIQVAAPYFHFMNGEGIYAMPEVGALAWLCKPSDGTMSQPFIMGFQGVHDEAEDSFRNNRQSLNPGDIMMKTRDENFVILRRGGVVQVGATPTAQRIYLPLQNFIRDFCENYQLFTFGGQMTWLVDRDDKTTKGNALTKFSLLAKEKADDPGHIAEMTIGSHGEGSATTLNLVIKDSGAEDAEAKVTLEITKEGDVSWEIQRDHLMVVHGDHRTVVHGDRVSEVDGDVSEYSGKSYSVEAEQNVEMLAYKDFTAEADFAATMKAGTIATIDGGSANHVGSGARHPLVYGDKLTTLLTRLITTIGTFSCPSAAVALGAPAPVVAAPSVLSMASDVPGLLSARSFTV